MSTKVCFDTELEAFPRSNTLRSRTPLGDNRSAFGNSVLSGGNQNNGDQNNGDQEVIFYRDPNVLLRRDRIAEFYPARHLDRTRKINAIARLVLYFAILYFFATGNLFLPLIGLVGLYLLIKNVLPKQLTVNHTGGMGYGFGTCYQSQTESPYKIQPTCDNPFMNPTVNDLMTRVDRGPAPSITQEPVASKVNDLFTERLYLGIDDIWQRQNGQRQFVTNPNTVIPNDQEGFARFLFDNPNHACRENYICKNDLRW